MIKIQFYKPNSISLPMSSTVQKLYPRISELDSDAQLKIDYSTIFFDVFYDASKNCLVGIGPEMLNLEQNLRPMKLIVDGSSVAFQLKHIKHLTFLETESFDTQNANQIDVMFTFKSFSSSLSINADACEKFVHNADSNTHHLTLTTLQKDNHIAWISDWILWHHKSYGVNRLVLYDNGSESRDAVIQMLNQLSIDINVVFVDWCFPYGLGRPPFIHCQLGSLNHCRMRFSVEHGYCMNLDIDEYLFLSKGTLHHYLDRKLRTPRIGSLAIRAVSVPNVSPEENNAPIRCWNFFYRDIVTGYQGEQNTFSSFGRTKYIYKFSNIGYNSVHSTASEKNTEFRSRYAKRTVVWFALKKLVWESTKKIFRMRYPKPRIDTTYGKIGDIFYFHFKGLNTGWRKSRTYKAREIYDSKRHIYEPRIGLIESAVLKK